MPPLVFQLAHFIQRKITPKRHPNVFQGQWVSVRWERKFWIQYGFGYRSLRLSSGFVGLMPGSQGSAKRLQRLTRNWKGLFHWNHWSPRHVVLCNLLCPSDQKQMGVSRRVWGTFPYCGFLLSMKMSQCSSSRSVDSWNVEKLRWYFNVMSLEILLRIDVLR